MGEAGPTFPNARHVAGRVECDVWAGQAQEAFEAGVRPLHEKSSFVAGGAGAAPGLAAVEPFGHSPGRMGRMPGSGDARPMLTGDTANHHLWSLGRPDREVRFDADKAAAADLRHDRRRPHPFAGDRMPFPGRGFVAARGDGFRHVPATCQTMQAG